MIEYLIDITFLFSIVFTVVVVALNSFAPALLQSLKPLAYGGLGLIGVVFYFFAYAYIEELVRVFRNQLVKQRGGYINVIVLPLIALLLLLIPGLMLEFAVSGWGWLPWMFIAGAIWRVVFFIFFNLHARIRAILLPEPKRTVRYESTTTEGLS